MLMRALLDTRANCNVISQRFKQSLQVTDKHTKITFANKENSEHIYKSAHVCQNRVPV
jgi:hypothetical protein